MSKKLKTIAEMKKAVEEFKNKFTPDFYHASGSPNIKKFDSSKSKKDADMTTPGVTFLSPKPPFSESFLPVKQSGEYKTGATMYPVSVDLSRNFDVDTAAGEKIVNEFIKKQYANDPKGADYFAITVSDPHNNWTSLEKPEFLQHLRDNGFTSFAVNEGGVKNVGVLDPSKIRGKFAEYNPEEAANPDFMKAEGGAVEGYAKGGLVHLSEGGSPKLKIAKYSISQIPEIARALEEYLKGNISKAQHMEVVRKYLPIRQWNEVPPYHTNEEVINALTTQQRPKAFVDVPAGMQTGNRLDIRAYEKDPSVYVDTVHDSKGKPFSYNRTGHSKDLTFSSKPNTFYRVGLGTKEQALTPMGVERGMSKTPQAMMKGTNVGTPDDEVRRMMAEMLKDPAYTQVGMDPRVGSQFYDKSTDRPIWTSGEKLQSGPLVIVPKKDIETTDWNDPRLLLDDFPGRTYAGGGKVGFAKKVLEHAKSVPFVHYSRAPNISTLDPNRYGTGIKGAEASRLKSAPDIRPRTYIYTKAGGRQPERGLGPHKYEGVAEDLYPLHEDPMGFSAIAKERAIDPYMMSMGREVVDEAAHLNELERLIKKAGYKGYANDDVGLLFDPTPVIKSE
jgi:hypothetical protein